MQPVSVGFYRAITPLRFGNQPAGLSEKIVGALRQFLTQSNRPADASYHVDVWLYPYETENGQIKAEPKATLLDTGIQEDQANSGSTILCGFVDKPTILKLAKLQSVHQIQIATNTRASLRK